MRHALFERPEPPVVAHSTAPSLLVLGTDAVLAAAPCTAIQVTHACLKAGFDAVVPASWGDELVAARVLEKAKQMSGPGVLCSCPRVADRLAAHGDAIAPMIVSTVAPPVATALYLRALYAPARPAITFAGGCTAGGNEAIDSWVSPAELFSLIASRGISLQEQPTEFDALPPDRRRFHSEPGGMPSRTALRQANSGVSCLEMTTADFVAPLAQVLLGDEPVLVDLAVGLGCSCAGAESGVTPLIARARVREHEPPRAPSPVVDHGVPVTLDARAPQPSQSPARGTPASPVVPPLPDRTPQISPTVGVEPQSVAVATETPRRRTPSGLPRPVLGASPRSSSAQGRALPRAYVARRRSSPRGMKTVDPPRASGSIGSASSRERLLWIAGGVLTGTLVTWLANLVF